MARNPSGLSRSNGYGTASGLRPDAFDAPFESIGSVDHLRQAPMLISIHASDAPINPAGAQTNLPGSNGDSSTSGSRPSTIAASTFPV